MRFAICSLARTDQPDHQQLPCHTANSSIDNPPGTFLLDMIASRAVIDEGSIVDARVVSVNSPVARHPAHHQQALTQSTAASASGPVDLSKAMGYRSNGANVHDSPRSFNNGLTPKSKCAWRSMRVASRCVAASHWICSHFRDGRCMCTPLTYRYMGNSVCTCIAEVRHCLTVPTLPHHTWPPAQGLVRHG